MARPASIVTPAGLVDRLERFTSEMRELGIHVGLGSPGKCTTCGEAWPCAGASNSDGQVQ